MNLQSSTTLFQRASKCAMLFALAAFTLSPTTLLAIQGEPIPSRDIILDEDPGNAIVSTGKTDEKGTATFAGLKAGKYSILLPDTSKFPVGSSVGTQRAFQMSINAHGKTFTAQPIPATKSATKVYATAQDGKKIVIIFEKDGGTISVNLTKSTAKEPIKAADEKKK